jgi:SAM-dependent methyltransferase
MPRFRIPNMIEKNTLLQDFQKIQEDEYFFPYHHVSQFRNGFTQCFNDTWGINYVATIEYILQQLKTETFDSLIDVGCGDGRLVGELNIEFPEKNIVGIDYSQQAINLARIMIPNGTFYDIDITNSSLNKQFDGGILMEVFEHIPPKNADKFLEGIASHLKQGAFLYVTVPHINKQVEYKHYRHFSVMTITDCLNDYFEVTNVVPFELNSKLKILIDKILTNRLFMLNNTRLKNWIYEFYKNKLFYAQEKTCKRIFLRTVKR